MTNTTATAAIISIRDIEDIDPLGSPFYVEAYGRHLLPGMVLVDNELGTPEVFLSHYETIGTPRNPGVKVWYTVDIDSGLESKTTIGPEAIVRVMV